MSNQVGTFITSYRVTTGLIGAPVLHLNLIVTTPTREISGAAEVTQPTNPPLDIKTQVSGDFTYLTVIPVENSHLLVVLESTDNGGPKVTARLVLTADWKSGSGSFTYVDSNFQKHTIEDAKVEAVEPVLAK